MRAWRVRSRLALPNEAYTLRSAEDVARQKQPTYAVEGTPTNVDVALEALRWSLGSEPKERCGLLAFGYPGTGKSTFVEALSWAACQEPRLFDWVLEVRCLDVALRQFDDAHQQVSRIWDIIEQKAPLLVFFDEIDTISRDRSKFDGTSVGILTAWTMALLKQAKKPPFALVGMTNHVRLCEAVIRTENAHRIYFPPPNTDVISSILGNFGVPKEVVAPYLALCDQQGKIPLHRTIAKAGGLLGRAVPHWKQLSTPEIAHWLFMLADPEPSQDVQAYRDANAVYIEYAMQFRERVALTRAAEKKP